VRDGRRESLDLPSADADSLRPSRDPLSRRLDSLPDGHPSSRYASDGCPNDRPPALRDLELEPDADSPHPFTDAEWSSHIQDVRTRLAEAQRANLSTDRQYTIDKAQKIWSDERDLVHDSIIDDIYKASDGVPCESKAIVAGGLGGAGKTTVLRERAGIDLTQYLTINPDDIKEEMARRSLIPEVDGLTPMEASDLAHEESSHIAKRLARRAEADGKNVIWDITMSSHESATARILNLREAGYKVEGIFVDISVETSIRRADARHQEGHDLHGVGIGLGGRYVPPEVIKDQSDPAWGSKNRKVFEDVKHLFDCWRRFDNSVDGRQPVLIETSTAEDPKARSNPYE
jgi:predicted kinase